MITFLSFASKKGESDLIKEQVRFQAGRRTDEVWNFEMFEQMKALEQYLKGEPVLDIISWDVTPDGSLKSLEQMRQQYRQAFLLVVADGTVSPMSYLRPGILPSSLLLKPIGKENLTSVVSEMMDAFSERFGEKESSEMFVIESRDGRQYIPFNQIYYIEAREKKIFVRTKQEEYGFYETIENMEKQLPESFCRCHRSYIVNMDKVTSVKVSMNLIELQGGMEVALSRSYKKTIKEYHQNVRAD